MNVMSLVQDGDTYLLKAINVTLSCRFLDAIMPIFTFLASKIFLFIFCFSALINQESYIHELGVKCAAALVFSTAMSQLIKKIANRTRPFNSVTGLNINKIGIDKYSFPSGHTTAAFTAAVMILLFYPGAALYTIFTAILTGISRIYLGVHYPSDVIAGMILGSLCSLFIYFI